VVHATVHALQSLRSPEEVKSRRKLADKPQVEAG